MIPLAIAAPATPPVLSDLVVVHTLFVRRKRKEQADLHDWYVLESQAVDKRARRAQRIAWINSVAGDIDAKQSSPCWDTTKDLN